MALVNHIQYNTLYREHDQGTYTGKSISIGTESGICPPPIGSTVEIDDKASGDKISGRVDNIVVRDTVTTDANGYTILYHNTEINVEQ